MWKLLILFVCFSTTFDNATANNRTSCLIKLHEIKALAPVILTSVSEYDYKLFKPTGKIVSIRPGSKLRLLCTGTNNAFENTGFDSMDLKCSKGNFEDDQKHIHNIHQLVCRDVPSSSLQITNERCGNNYGLIYNIGFGDNGQFHGPLFEICYCSGTDRAIYAHVTLNGAAIDNFSQLAAETDFIFGYEQLATRYYVNAVPEFRDVDVGNWLRVEELARATAIIYKDDIEAYTGHMSTLKLPHPNGSQVEIYLDAGNKFKVPKYFYKVLMHKAADAAIVLVTVNNPYILNGPAEEFCPNVCEAAGIVNPSFQNTKEGYTFCCEISYFKRTVDTLKDEVRGSRLLKFATVIELD